MTIYPQRTPEYVPPPVERVEEYVSREVLEFGQELRVRYHIFDDRVMTFFAVMQITHRDDGWTEVARIDTCHATVHKHQLHKGSSDTVGTRTELSPIPVTDPYITIETWYSESLKHMHNEWQENLRLWGGDYG